MTIICEMLRRVNAIIFHKKSTSFELNIQNIDNEMISRDIFIAFNLPVTRNQMQPIIVFSKKLHYFHFLSLLIYTLLNY